MGLKLEWEWNGGHGVATVGGLRLQVQNEYHPVTWWVRTQPWGDHHEVEVIGGDWLAATLAAQEAAEAAAARLLAEDAGVRALLGLRWIPVAGRLPDEGVEVLVSRARLNGTRDVRARVWQPAKPSWVPVSEPTPFGVWAGALGWVPVNDSDLWRPLPFGPEVGQ